WCLERLKALHVISLTTEGFTLEPFFRSLGAYLQEQKGYSRLAQVTGIDRTVLYRWVDPNDSYHPTLETLFKFCYVLHVTPLQVMRSQLDQLKQTIKTSTELHSPLPQHQQQRLNQ